MAHDIYRLTIQGHLDSQWSEWFDGLAVTLADNGETVLTGPIVDQAALHGILIKIRDLSLPLLSLTRFDPDSADRITGRFDTKQQHDRE